MCDGQVDGGYYGDPEAECQAFHICAGDGSGGLAKYSFLCPNGTLFQQQYFVCDWWFNVDCSTTEDFYGLNDEIAAEREANSPAGGAGGGARGGAGGGRRGGQGAASYNSPSYSSPQVRLSTRGQRSVCPQAGYTRNQRDLPGSPQQQQYLAQLLAQTTQVGGGSLVQNHTHVLVPVPTASSQGWVPL